MLGAGCLNRIALALLFSEQNPCQTVETTSCCNSLRIRSKLGQNCIVCLAVSEYIFSFSGCYPAPELKEKKNAPVCLPMRGLTTSTNTSFVAFLGREKNYSFEPLLFVRLRRGQKAASPAASTSRLVQALTLLASYAWKHFSTIHCALYQNYTSC